MFEALGVEALIFGVSIGGSLIGLAAVAVMLHGPKHEPGRQKLSEIVASAPYDRLENNLKVAKV